MKFELTILGSSGAVPFKDRYMTAHVLNVREQLFLIDCGEGTQMRMTQHQVRRGKINHIFISHLHGDHIFGLPGLITSFSLNRRKKPLHIYSPKGLSSILKGLFSFAKPATYPIIYHETDPTKHQIVFENEEVEVWTIPLVHGIPCNGYLFREKQLPNNMIRKQITHYNIPFSDIPAIKAGADWQSPLGNIIPNSELTTPSALPRSYAFCSDTLYSEQIIPCITEVDLLYHEGTFLHADLEKAQATQHTTAHQAALIAKKANVKQLVIGHYSARYESLSFHRKEAQAIFPNTILAHDGIKIAVENN